jgi:hypothetical protein
MSMLMRDEDELARAAAGTRVGAFISAHRVRGTAANASTNGGSRFAYHAALRVGSRSGESW